MKAPFAIAGVLTLAAGVFVAAVGEGALYGTLASRFVTMAAGYALAGAGACELAVLAFRSWRAA